MSTASLQVVDVLRNYKKFDASLPVRGEVRADAAHAPLL